MKKTILFSIILIFLSLIIALAVSAQEDGSKYDFSHMKEVDGNKFTLHYPTGYDKEASYLIEQMNKIIPFVEAYGGLEFHHINITIVKSREEIGGIYGYAAPDEEQFVIPADFYNAPVVYHESCHLVEKPFYYPSWFSEGHVLGYCQRKLEEFLGRFDIVEYHKKLELEYKAKLRDIKVDISNYTTPYEYSQELSKATGIPAEDINIKVQYDAQDLMGELSEVVNFTEFFKKARKDFDGYTETLPNDAVICKMNEVATKDVIPIFKKYGFKIEDCSAKVYQFLEIQKQEEKGVQKQQEEQVQEDKITNILINVILAVIILLPIFLIYLLIRLIRKRKK